VLSALQTPPAKPAPPPKPEPDHPLLTLLGTVVGESMEIGVFIDDALHDVIRLKAGEVRDGWTLSSVSGRAAIFQKQGCRDATLVLPAAATERNAPSVAAAPDMKPGVVPGNGQMTGVPRPHRFAPPVIPATTKGGSTRPPREG
jgi:hypothetical protein